MKDKKYSKIIVEDTAKWNYEKGYSDGYHYALEGIGRFIKLIKYKKEVKQNGKTKPNANRHMGKNSNNRQ